MKTLKKLFSVSAIVALLGTLAPMYAFGATYTAELEEAYNYAYKNGITTMTSIDNANMFGSLTRIAMAKMIANYATTVLGLEPDTSAKCTFTDVTAALDAQYDNGVTKACQLGLMGQNITAFRPNDPVTRAEFGTTLSRALNSNDADKLAEMNAADPYYKEHLNFLKNEGIMTQIDNPSMTEVRGYVMLMMMRADESYTPAEGCTAEELLACVTADDYDACIAACSGEEEEEEEVENGFVTISKVSAAATQEVARNASKKNVGTIKLKAGDEGAVVSSIIVKRSGLGTPDAVSVQLTNKNGTITTTARKTNSNGEATVRFSPALELKANESMNLDVLVNLLAGVGANETHNFEVIGANLANGKAEGSASLGTLKTTSYTVNTIGVTFSTATATVNAGEDAKTIEAITFTPSRKVKINGFTLTKVGGALDFDKGFGEIKAYYNNEEIGTVTVTSDKIIVSDLNIEKDSSSTARIELKATSKYVGAAVSNTADINFETEADIDVVEVETNENVQITTKPADLTVTFGAVTLTVEKTTEKTQTVAPGTSEVVLYEAKVSSSTEFDVVDYDLIATNGATVFVDGKITLYVDGNPVELYQNAATHVKDPKFTAGTKTWNFTANDLFTVTPKHSVTIKVVANIISDLTPVTPGDETQSYTFRINKVRDVDNTSNVLTLAPAVAELGDVTEIAEGSLTLKTATVAAPASRNVWANGSNIEVSRFAVKAESENVTISKVTFNRTPALTTSNAGAVNTAIAAIPAADGAGAVDTAIAAIPAMVDVANESTIAAAIAAIPADDGTNSAAVDAAVALLQAITATPDTTTLKNIVSTAKLINVDTNDVISSNGKINEETIEFNSINLVAEKDTDINVKLVITTKGFKYSNISVARRTLTLTPAIAPADTNRDSGGPVASVASTVTVNDYSIGVKSPAVTMVKSSDNLYKVTVTNADTENALNLQAVKLRVKPVADTSSYNGNYCLRPEGSSESDCAALVGPGLFSTMVGGLPVAPNYMIPGAATEFTLVTPVEIAKSSSYTFEVYVDSNYVNPTTLSAELTKLTYAEGSESYSVTAQ